MNGFRLSLIQYKLEFLFTLSVACVVSDASPSDDSDDYNYFDDKHNYSRITGNSTISTDTKSFNIYYILIPAWILTAMLVIAIVIVLKKVLSISKKKVAPDNFAKPDIPSIVIARNSTASELSDTSGSTLNSNL
jgi:hypothetical protein